MLAIDDLVGDLDRGNQHAKERAELVGDKILKAKTQEEDEENMLLKFDAEEKETRLEFFKDSVRNLRIAVIDDDLITQELIKHTFEETGAYIFTFSDGDEFLANIDLNEYDLAFLDLIMPKVDGFEVLQALQARSVSYPIIVLSAVNQRETIIKAIQMGVKSYLVKPLRSEDIFMKSIEILKANF